MTTTTAAPLDTLDALARQAEQIDTDAAAQPMPGQDAPPPPISNAQAVAGALAAGREAFCFFTKLQSPRQVLTDDRVQDLAALAAPVLEKHGIDLGQYIGDFGPELALAAGVFAVVLELRQAVTLEMASKKPRQAAPEADTVEAFTTANDGQ